MCGFKKCNYIGNNSDLLTHIQEKHTREDGVGIVCKVTSLLIFCAVFSGIIILIKISQVKGKINKELQDRIQDLGKISVYKEHERNFLYDKLAYIGQLQGDRKGKINIVMPDYLGINDLFIETKANLSLCENAKEKLTLSLNKYKNISPLVQSVDNAIYLKEESILNCGHLQIANDILYFQNDNLKSTIKKLKNGNVQLKSRNNYFNFKQAKVTTQLTNEQMFLKYFIQQIRQLIKILKEENNFLIQKNKERFLTMKNRELENKIEIVHNNFNSLLSSWDIVKRKYMVLEEENRKYGYAEIIWPPRIGDYPCPLLGLITVDSTRRELREYSSGDGNSFTYTGWSMSTFGNNPIRGGSNGISYVLPDTGSTNIGFYNLSSLGSPPAIKSQSGIGDWGSCGFLTEVIALCSTRTGDIYIHMISLKIATNPSGEGFETVIGTSGGMILGGYKGCIYIYTSTGDYVGYSGSSQPAEYIFQMEEVRSNIIVTAEFNYLHSHHISDPALTIRYKLLDYAQTDSKYCTIEGLIGNREIAIGGYYNSSGSIYGYVEIFNFGEDNASLQSKSNKRWVGLDSGCWIYIIREIQRGVIIFGEKTACSQICTWEYAVVPSKQPICFPLGGSEIHDIISIP